MSCHMLYVKLAIKLSTMKKMFVARCGYLLKGLKPAICKWWRNAKDVPAATETFSLKYSERLKDNLKENNFSVFLMPWPYTAKIIF